jgi:hypothetical protein
MRSTTNMAKRLKPKGDNFSEKAFYTNGISLEVIMIVSIYCALTVVGTSDCGIRRVSTLLVLTA